MYKDEIQKLITDSPLEINTKILLQGRAPTLASSEFLTNKEQGDWAEKIVFKAINGFSNDYFAVKYGRSDSIAVGDEGFAEFYLQYQNELNTIGKKPDLLIFKISDFPNQKVDLQNEENIKKAVAALEVRSSSFLSKKYSNFMDIQQGKAIENCIEIRNLIINSKLGELLERKNKQIYDLIYNSTDETFKELDFRRPSWSSTPELEKLTSYLKELKENIKILHKRDYLSVTPKMEDIALVNRWIQKYNIKHFYLQVFFDKAYIISFKKILELVANENNEGSNFSIEKDVKNQGKTTIKINIKLGKEILGKIEMPEHKSTMKELDRGRLLFYVTFEGGKGYLDNQIFIEEIVNA